MDRIYVIKTYSFYLTNNRFYRVHRNHEKLIIFDDSMCLYTMQNSDTYIPESEYITYRRKQIINSVE